MKIAVKRSVRVSFTSSILHFVVSLSFKGEMGRPSRSSTSSIDSNSHPSFSSASSACKRDLSTDLKLGLSISTSHPHDSSVSRDQCTDWPPIKPLLRNTLAENGCQRQEQTTFFVKVYMEGVPIGRKLDLFAHNSYESLIWTLRWMFRTSILCSEFAKVSSSDTHILTYEDKEGDWMMVGDVPWEMFLATVKRLKITRADKC